MVKCTIAFNHEDQKWTHAFDVPEGATILDLKTKMLAPKGTKRDVDAFELRLRGQRVSDAEQIYQEHTLDFEYLGPDEGAKRAREDVEDQKAREKAAADAEAAAKRREKNQRAEAQAKASLSKDDAKPKAKAKPASEFDIKEVPGKPLWKVVGGGDKGGILVRKGLQTSSPQLPDRLSTGAVVEEVELEGERLNYKRITGTGPDEGWVSLSIAGKDLMKKAAAADAFTLERAIKMQEELIQKFSDPAFVQAMAYIDDEFSDKKNAEFQKRKQTTIFGAQRDIIASYGFEGSQKGVMMMMAAFGPHMKNPTIDKNGAKINKLLGL